MLIYHKTNTQFGSVEVYSIYLEEEKLYLYPKEFGITQKLIMKIALYILHLDYNHLKNRPNCFYQKLLRFYW